MSEIEYKANEFVTSPFVSPKWEMHTKGFISGYNYAIESLQDNLSELINNSVDEHGNISKSYIKQLILTFLNEKL